MKKINFNRLENIQGGSTGGACYFSSIMAAAGVLTMNVALVHVGATAFYGCVRYL